MEIRLTNDQKNAVEKIRKWWGDKKNFTFTLTGYAGTGKTTTLREALKELDISWSRVCFMTYTGKASLVLREKGIPANTVHSSIYVPTVTTEEKLPKMERRETSEEYSKRVEELRVSKKIPIKKRLAFRKKAKDQIKAMYDIFIIDEVSMISKEMMDEIMSFELKVLVLGDIGQLNPVKGAVNDLLLKPDHNLEEVHRQAKESPFIKLTELIRKGRSNEIGYGWYGDNIVFLREINWDSHLIRTADQILCWKNSTRKEINNLARWHYEKDTSKIIDEGEKLICLKNDYSVGMNNPTLLAIKGRENLNASSDLLESVSDIPLKEQARFYNLPLVNGMIGYASNVVTGTKEVIGETSIDLIAILEGEKIKEEKTLKIDFRPTFGREHEYYDKIPIDLPTIRDGKKIDHLKTKNGKGYFDYGYAITVHKSQGSEFDNVLVVNEMPYNFKDYDKWLYTALTRHKKNLVVVDRINYNGW